MKKALAGLENTVPPIMPATENALRELFSRPSARNENLQEVLLRDPAAVIALYRRVEKSRKNAASSITDPAHALSMIGLQAFQSLIAELPILNTNIDQGNQQNSIQHAYSQASHAAWYAGRLSHQLDIGHSAEVSSAALLQNPAVILLWHKDPFSAQRANNAVRDGLSFDMAFSAELGEPLRQCNQKIAKAWGLSPSILTPMQGWSPSNHQHQLISVANMMAQAACGGWPSLSSSLFSEILEDFINMKRGAAIAWWKQSTVTAARILQPLEYPVAAFELLYTSDRDAALEEHLNEAKMPILGCTKKEKLPPPDLHSVLADTMKRMKSFAGVDRCAFVLLNKERTLLKTRLAIGGDKTDLIRKLQLAANKKNLLSLLLAKQQSIWVNPSNQSKYSKLMPESLQLASDNAGFFTMSLFVNKKPLGILYADGGKQTENSYKRFRLLCQEVGQVLEGKREAA